MGCSASGKTLCEAQRVQGFPTLKSGTDPASLADYSGGRGYEALRAHADGPALAAACGPAPRNLPLCDAREKAAIAALQALPPAELARRIALKTKELEAAEAVYQVRRWSIGSSVRCE